MDINVASLIHDLSQFGSLGLVVAFIWWWCARADKLRDKEDERRMEFDKARLAMDKELSSALAALTATIQSSWGRR